MIQDLKKGQTLLVKGPSRVTLLEGKLEIFGTIFVANSHPEVDSMYWGVNDSQNIIIVPGANSYPLYAIETAKIEVYTNLDMQNLKLIDENSITDEWIKIKDSIVNIIKKETEKPLKVMVLGMSSGKTTLIKYLANNLLNEGFKGGYLDSDLGQQIMFLPTTLNIGEIKSPVISSEDLTTELTEFIGATFPKGNYKFIVAHSCKDLINNFKKKHKNTDFILIDSDGWIKTEAGIIYKNFFIKNVDPDVLIVFNDKSIEELQEIVKEAKSRKNRKIFLIENQNDYFYEKSKEERRFLRQSQFARVLETYRKMSIPLNDIKFVKTDYDKENDEIIEREINVRELIHLPYHFVIMALMTEKSELIKIGLLFSINIEKEYILLFSDLNYKEQIRIKKILLGSLRLSTKGNHQGYLYL